jgi:hypothetical protein
MKKILAILSIFALVSCGGSSTDTTVDSLAVEPVDSVEVVVDSVKVEVDTTKVLGGNIQDGSEVK